MPDPPVPPDRLTWAGITICANGDSCNLTGWSPKDVVGKDVSWPLSAGREIVVFAEASTEQSAESLSFGGAIIAASFSALKTLVDSIEAARLSETLGTLVCAQGTFDNMRCFFRITSTSTLVDGDVRAEFDAQFTGY